MKYFSALFSLVALVILMVEIMVFSNQYDVYKRDFDTKRLEISIDNAEEAAFQASLKSGTTGSDYTELLNVTCDPRNTLEVFADVMCASYDMAITEENRQRIYNSMDGAVLVDKEGYYITLPTKFDDSRIENEGLYSSNQGEETLTVGNDTINQYKLSQDTGVIVDISENNKTDPDATGDSTVKRIMNGIKLTDDKKYYSIIENGKDIIQRQETKLVWSPKVPFSYDITSPINGTVAFNAVNHDLYVYNKDAKSIYFKRNKEVSSNTYKKINIQVRGTTYEFNQQIPKVTGDYAVNEGNIKNSEGVDATDLDKVRAINNEVADALNFIISKTTKIRSENTYRVYLPAETSLSGANPVVGNCLIVLISEADYANKAHLTEIVMGGHRVTTKTYYMGFEQDGTKYYCKSGQLPTDEHGDIPTIGGVPLYSADTMNTFLSAQEAARNGYYPNIQYLSIPLPRR